MQRSEIKAHIHFKHTPEEVAELNTAWIPMQEHIAAVSSHNARLKMRYVLDCQYFRAKDAALMIQTLLAAAKYAKLHHLDDYFPLMRAQILDDALALEEAAINYRTIFARLKHITVPGF